MPVLPFSQQRRYPVKTPHDEEIRSLTAAAVRRVAAELREQLGESLFGFALVADGFADAMGYEEYRSRA